MNKIVLLGTSVCNKNRGVNALAIGHIVLLMQNYDFDTVYSVTLSKRKSETSEIVAINGKQITFINKSMIWTEFLVISILFLFIRLFKLYDINDCSKFLKDVDIVCASNGGDSFSDIYGLKRLFLEFLSIITPELLGKKVVFTPQTIGPFYSFLAKIMAFFNLKLASKVFVRDNKGDKFLSSMRVKAKLTRDISSYMIPEKIDYVVKPNTLGINVNGLMWENNYTGLENCFDNYRILMKKLCEKILEQGYNILFVPHTYSIESNMSENDYTAIKDLMKELDTERISCLEEEYTAPQLKYIISQTDFFIGSRMHSNLAALTTSTPTVALAYSYKFDGTFKMFNVSECVIQVKDMQADEVSSVIDKVMNCFSQKNNIISKLKKVNSSLESIEF